MGAKPTGPLPLCRRFGLQERLSRVSQPCSVQLVTAAAGFFTGVMREGGSGAVVQDGLLAAVAEYVLLGCNALEGSVGAATAPMQLLHPHEARL